MYYYVIGADGGRYGPADIDTLVRWALEGRIIASTTLIDRGTEQSIPAESVTAIAAAIRRAASGAAAVAIERDASAPGEAATVTRTPSPGQPVAGPYQQPGPPDPAVPPIPPFPQQVYARPMPGPYGPMPANLSPRSKVVAGLLGIFLGWLGIHRFYLGYNGIGLIMLILTVIGGVKSLGCSAAFVGLWGFVEGIICLCGGMRDAEGRDLRN